MRPVRGHVEAFQRRGELVLARRGEEVGRGPLHHRHVRGAFGNRRDQRRGRRPRADHDDPLPGQVEVLRPLLRVHQQPLVALEALPAGPVRLVVVVVAGAQQQEPGGVPQQLAGVAPGDVHGPAPGRGRPARRGDAVPAADVRCEAVLGDDLVEVVEDRRARRDRRAAPRLEPVAVGVQVAVGADPGVAVRPPGPAVTVACLKDDEAPAGEPLPQVVRGADPGDSRPDDEEVDLPGVAAGPAFAGVPGFAGRRPGFGRGHGPASRGSPPANHHRRSAAGPASTAAAAVTVRRPAGAASPLRGGTARRRTPA